MSALAVIPYWPQPVFETSWIRIQTWDVLVAVGFLTGVWLAGRMSRSIGRDSATISDMGPWVLVSGFIGAHLVHVFFYEPEILSRDPLFLLVIWSGLSSFGGFLGAAVGITWFFRRRAVSFWRYADALAVGMAVAWTIARVGCFFAHDHKGRFSDFFLAVDFPGGARHDLGLYDAIVSAGLSVACYLMFRSRPHEGRVTALLCGIYAVTRFFLDFLRATDLSDSDLRYGGLTPAQYGCFVLLGFAWYAWKRSSTQPRLGDVASAAL